MRALRSTSSLLVLLLAVPAHAAPRAAWQQLWTAPVSAPGAAEPRFPEADDLCELARVDRGQTSSVVCLACHDGTTTFAAVHRGAVGASSHPVEIDYGAARTRRPAALHPQSALPASLVLPRGNVTCTTCHDARSPEPAHVAAPMAGSRLCLACHSI